MGEARRVRLSPVARPRVFSDVVIQIKKMIAGGHLGPGDRLPPERELEQMLRVSRTSVREAIRALETQGIVEIRRGSGTYVTRGASGAFLRDEAEDVARSEGGPEALTQARLALEPTIARMAATHRASEQLERLREATQAMREQIGAPDPTREHDVRFHQTLAESTGNPILAEFGHRLCALRQRLPWKLAMNASLHESKIQEAFVEQHEEILESIGKRRPDEAEARMREHIDKTGDRARARKTGKSKPAKGGRRS